MKRIIIYCCLMLMCIDIMAQYEGNQNYNVFQDQFDTSGRIWDKDTYFESTGRWRAFFRGSGLTHGSAEHQAYQRSQAVFDDNNEMMLLVADYVSDININCDDLERPDEASCNIDDTYSIRYLSGALESIYRQFRYGYFEIRCKLPVHKGAFPAFWLWGQCKPENDGCIEPHYEEIDIFEYSWTFTDSLKTPNTEALYLGDNRCFTAGLYINDTGISDEYLWQYGAARIYPRISENEPSLDQWNTWGCLWMPDKVEWYLNGELFNSLYDIEKIPHNPMYLIINYAIDSNASNEEGDMYCDVNDTMYIDYIKVFQPKWDCCSVMIDEQSDMDYYEHGIKSSVTIDSNSNVPVVVDVDKTIDIMASESVTISGPFQVDAGAKFSITMQKCP